MFKQWENTAMRLTTDQIQAIRQTAQRVLGAGARVSVFGSRALDNGKGGDIDLFFETDALLENRAKVLCQLHGALTLALGERKIDVILKDANTPPAPVFEIAKRTGILL
jgi:predicted nucleotidyltransferase